MLMKNFLNIFAILLLLCFGQTEGYAQTKAKESITVQGVIKDKAGETIIGAIIIAKNQPGLGVASDADGKFKFKVDTYDILVFSCTGMETKELPVLQIKDPNNVTVILEENAQTMDEVVITGSGLKKKKTLTGAFTTVETKLLNAPSGQLTNSLGGVVPGIITQQLSGEPGENMSDFWIRGISTFGANSSALVLVDGVERSLNEISVEDIESFSVLKDASATAIYGQRGANGVVLITTKKGEKGKVKINVKLNYGFDQTGKLPAYANAYDYSRLANEAKVGRYESPLYTEQELRIIENGLDPDLYPNVDWQDIMLKKGASQYRAQLDLSGGSDNITYFVSGSYYNQDGIYRTHSTENKYNTNSTYERYNYRANTVMNITKTTKVTAQLGGYLINRTQPGSTSADIWQSFTKNTPLTSPRKYSTGQWTEVNGTKTPELLMTQTGYKTIWQNKMEVTVNLEQDMAFITSGLKFSGVFAFDSWNDNNITRKKMPELWAAQNYRDSYGNLILRKISDVQNMTQESTTTGNKRYYMQAQLEYERLIAQNHRVGAFAMMYRQEVSDTNLGTDIIASIPKRNLAYSGRITYAYKDRYLAEFNAGYTGSENFEAGSQFGFFPAYSAGWIASEEPFIKGKLPWLTLFKVRGSYGEVGNDVITGAGTRFPYITLIQSDPSGYSWGEFNSNTQKGYRIQKIGTQNLTWEIAKKWNVGVDFSLFKDKLTGTVDWFKDTRSDIFMTREYMPLIIGLADQKPMVNIGRMQAQGIDGNIAFTQRIGKVSLTWRANMTYQNTEILDKDEAANELWYKMEKGFRQGQTRGYISLGLFKDQEDIDSSPTQTSNTPILPGDIKYKDVNGDGKITTDDIVPIGYKNAPGLMYGTGLNLDWENFTFSFLLQGAGKRDFFVGNSGPHAFREGSSGNILQLMVDGNRWIPKEVSGTIDTENPNADWPRLTYGNNDNNNQASTFWIKNGSYLRLKNVEITYRVPQSFTRKFNMSGMRIGFIGENLHTWSSFKWWDPEGNNENGSAYPIPRTYSCYVNFSF